MRKSLNDIEFPKFSPAQLKFFKEVIELINSDLLALEPREADFHHYQLQWNSLVAKRDEYQWLIDSNESVIEAERQERLEGAEYDPQKLLEEKSSDAIELTVRNVSIL